MDKMKEASSYEQVALGVQRENRSVIPNTLETKSLEIVENVKLAKLPHHQFIAFLTLLFNEPWSCKEEKQ